MTKPELREWITARALTQHQAAQLLGLSRGALVRQLSDAGTGATRNVGDQTAIICELRDTVDDLAADMDQMAEDENRRYNAGD